MNRLVLACLVTLCVTLAPTALAGEPEPGIDCKPGWESVGTVENPLTGEQVYDVRTPTGDVECW